MNLKARSQRDKRNPKVPKKCETMTVTDIPPSVMHYFDRKLLSNAIPGMKYPQYYKMMYEDRILARYGKDSRAWKEYELIMQAYEEIYEWTKAEEAYEREEKKKELSRPVMSAETFYRVRGKLGKVFRNYMDEAIQFTKHRRNNANAV